MSYTKYPEAIQYYHDLFEGNFFDKENQKLFAEASSHIREKIYRMLTTEAEYIKHDNLSDSTDWYIGRYSNRYREKTLKNTMKDMAKTHAISPIDYVTSLNAIDRKNIYSLVFDILYNEGEGIYRRSNITSAMVVWSTTYDDNYWKDLKNWYALQEADIDSDTQQRINKKGNDIDILFSLPFRDDDNRIAHQNAYELIEKILQEQNIDYVLDKTKREDGTSYTKDINNWLVIPHKAIRYGSPNFVIHFPQWRPIHISVNYFTCNKVYYREFLEWRPFAPLFDGPTEQQICKKIFEDIKWWKNYPSLSTLEERYAILQENKKDRYRKKIQNKIAANKAAKKTPNIDECF